MIAGKISIKINLTPALEDKLWNSFRPDSPLCLLLLDSGVWAPTAAAGVRVY